MDIADDNPIDQALAGTDEAEHFYSFATNTTFWSHYKLDRRPVLVTNSLEESPTANVFQSESGQKECKYMQLMTGLSSDAIPELRDEFEFMKKPSSKAINYLNNPYQNQMIDKHNQFLQELLIHHRKRLKLPTINDVTTAFCGKCDELTKLWLGTDNFAKASIWLRKQLKFKNGKWFYERQFKLIFKWFPKGLSLADRCAEKYSDKYTRPQFVNCKNEINYRLLLDYETHRLMTLDNYMKLHPELKDIDQNIKYLPFLVVHNPMSSSTPLRLCLIPNRMQTFTVQMKELEKYGYLLKEGEKSEDYQTFNTTYNDMIKGYSTYLPPIFDNHLKFTTGLILLFADISDFFKGINFEPITAIGQVARYYKDKNGNPVITSDNGAQLESWVYLRMNYGSQDAPATSQIALIGAVQSYKENTPLIINEVLLDETQKWLLQLYVDDYSILSHAEHVLNFMTQLPALISTTNTVSQEYIKNDLCAVCKSTHQPKHLTYWKTPLNPRKNQLYLPFDCPLFKDCEYMTMWDTKRYETGPYQQHLTGLENIYIMIFGEVNSHTSTFSRELLDIEIEERMDVDQFTYFIKALARHYVLLIAYYTQSVINFSSFYFKELLTTDPCLKEVLDFLLVIDTEMEEAKAKLKHNRPDVKLVQGELTAKPIKIKLNKTENAGKDNATDEYLDKLFPADEFSTESCETSEAKESTPWQDKALYSEGPSNNINCTRTEEGETPLLLGDDTALLIMVEKMLLDTNSYTDYANQKEIWNHLLNTTEIRADNTPTVFATQLGRDFVECKEPRESHHVWGDMMLSKKHQGLSVFMKSGKVSPVVCNDLEHVLHILSTPNYYFTKRSLLCLFAQIFDICGQFLIMCTMIAKKSWSQICYAEPDVEEWDDKLPVHYVNIAKLFAEYFFTKNKTQIARTTFLLHPECDNYLLYMSDAGGKLLGYTIFLISYHMDKQNKVRYARYQNLIRQSFSCPRKTSSEALELAAFFKATQVANQVYTTLQAEGMKVKRKNIIGVSDSRISIFQCRYLDSKQHMDERVKAYSGRIQVLFASYGMSLLSQIRFWDQKKIAFPADSLTKFNSEIPTLNHLLTQDDQSKTLPSILMDTPVPEWDHLTLVCKGLRQDELHLIPEAQEIELDITKYGMTPNTETPPILSLTLLTTTNEHHPKLDSYPKVYDDKSLSIAQGVRVS